MRSAQIGALVLWTLSTFCTVSYGHAIDRSWAEGAVEAEHERRGEVQEDLSQRAAAPEVEIEIENERRDVEATGPHPHPHTHTVHAHPHHHTSKVKNHKTKAPKPTTKGTKPSTKPGPHSASHPNKKTTTAPKHASTKGAHPATHPNKKTTTMPKHPNKKTTTAPKHASTKGGHPASHPNKKTTTMPKHSMKTSMPKHQSTKVGPKSASHPNHHGPTHPKHTSKVKLTTSPKPPKKTSTPKPMKSTKMQTPPVLSTTTPVVVLPTSTSTPVVVPPTTVPDTLTSIPITTPTVPTTTAGVSGALLLSVTVTGTGGAGPLGAIPTANVYQHVACVVQPIVNNPLNFGDSVAILTGSTPLIPIVNVEFCAAACSLGGFNYFLVSEGDLCNCGNWLDGNYGFDESGCDLPCLGNPFERCGGLLGRGDLYELQNPIFPSEAPPFSTNGATAVQSISAKATRTNGGVVQTNAAYVYQGCYIEPFAYLNDGGSVTILDGGLHTNIIPFLGGMTAQFCANACAGFQFFLLEGGFECYCGTDLLGDYALDDPSGCSIPCTGGSNQLCGGVARGDLYQLTFS